MASVDETLDAPAVPRLPGYRLAKQLGAGGQGEVWQAIRLKDNRKAAVKFIRPDRLADAGAGRRPARANRPSHRRILAGDDSLPRAYRYVPVRREPADRRAHATALTGDLDRRRSSPISKVTSNS